VKKRSTVVLACGATLVWILLAGPACTTYYDSAPDTLSGMTESQIKAYITPDCTAVEQCLHDVLGDTPYQPSTDGFDAVRDWVAASIEYETDEEQWGVEDYWQTPEETLSLRTGDCEDFAILLCTLLRAYGIDGQHIYVAVGVDDDGNGHAFLIEDWCLDGEWRAIEPQAGSQTFPPGRRFEDYSLADFKLLRDYEIILGFNDSSYYDESFPWDEY
jgi:predicted transglutaminase-like cysteine proteinase